MNENSTIEPTHDMLVFVCCNKKSAGKCCAMAGAENVYNYLRQEFNLLRSTLQPSRRIKAVKTSCLGKCATGPNLLISPDNTWYHFSNLDDIKEIVSSHILAGKKVSRLLKQE